MKFFDYSNKKITRWNRNYFFAFTIFFILLQIVLFMVFAEKNIFEKIFSDIVNDYSFVAMVKRFLIQIGGHFTHVSWSHVIGNMIGFFFCLFYLERKYGTIKTAGLVFSTTIFCSFPFIFDDISICGSSVVWFALFGFVIVDILFSLKKSEFNLANLLIGLFIVVFEILVCSFDDPQGVIIFSSFLYQMLENSSHVVGLFIGVSLSLFIHIATLGKFQKNQ